MAYGISVCQVGNRQKVEIIVKVSAVVGKYEQPYCFPEKLISQWEGTD